MRLGDQRWTSEQDEKLLKAGSLYPTLNGYDWEKLLAMQVELQIDAGIEFFGKKRKTLGARMNTMFVNRLPLKESSRDNGFGLFDRKV